MHSIAFITLLSSDSSYLFEADEWTFLW